MTGACAERRVMMLSRHLSTGVILPVTQACAATQRINFARAANGEPAFAQSVAQCHAHKHTQEALMWADRTLSAVQSRQQSAAAAIEHHPSKVVSGLMDMSSEPSFTRPAARDSVMEGHTAAALAAYRQATSKVPPAKTRSKATRRVPSLQVQATEAHDGYEIRVALPGVHPDDVRLELGRGRQLLISGQQSAPRKVDGAERALTVFNGGFFGPLSLVNGHSLFSASVNERTFSASCPLPRDADLASARAHLADGLLRITFRRKK